jgi:hypothetical protein
MTVRTENDLRACIKMFMGGAHPRRDESGSLARGSEPLSVWHGSDVPPLRYRRPQGIGGRVPSAARGPTGEDRGASVRYHHGGIAPTSRVACPRGMHARGDGINERVLAAVFKIWCHSSLRISLLMHQSESLMASEPSSAITSRLFLPNPAFQASPPLPRAPYSFTRTKLSGGPPLGVTSCCSWER